MAKNQDLGFAPNYMSALEIDTTPDAASPTWAIFSRGITEVKPTTNETTETKDYYDGYGTPTDKVKSVQPQYEVTGDRCYGDPAQDFVASLALETGEGRTGHFRHTDPNGDVVEGDCTYLGLTVGSQQGAASDPGAFSCTISGAGAMRYIPANKLKQPTGVTCTAPTGPAVGKSMKLTPTVMPAEANAKCFFASGNTDVATVDSDGNVTGVAAGEAVITVRCASKPSICTQVKVTVAAK